MNFGILGGGFGIYGWLSALSNFKNVNIFTLSKYTNLVKSNTDIEDLYLLINKINWIDNESLLFKNIDVLIIARRPDDQVKVVEKLIRESWRGTLIIEKPIAPSPHKAKIIIQKLIDNNIDFQVGFSIMETDWSKKIKKVIQNKNKKVISINWNFYAHHYKNRYISWKSNPKCGGGSLSFYCIHLIAWLASFSDWNVVFCSPLINENNDPNVNFQLSNKNTILNVSCNSLNKEVSSFEIIENQRQDTTLLIYETPFNEDINKFVKFKYDERVPYLRKIIAKTLDKKFLSPFSIKKHIKLWESLDNTRITN